MAKKYLDHDIPEGRRSLIECRDNLMGISDYCEQNYASANNKRKALEVTQQFTTQSLASVAYQVHTLASSMLNLLAEQDDELTRLNSAIDNLSERVDIHCEKVARREVGALTARKPISKAPTIITPVNPERPVKYVRKQINYGELDEIGHGVKMGSTATMRQAKNASINSRSTLSRSQSQLDESRSQYNTIGRAVGVPTIPRSMAPPLYQNDQRERRASGASGVSNGSDKNPIVASVINGSSNRSSIIDDGVGASVPAPPPPAFPEPAFQNYDLPPPPPETLIAINGGDRASLSSNSINEFPEPLPPPPQEFNTAIATDGFVQRKSTDPAWAPLDYIEKVRAVYGYEAEVGDELTFDENATIYVIAKNEDGWWEGKCNGATGLFPGNYVEFIDE